LRLIDARSTDQLRQSNRDRGSRMDELQNLISLRREMYDSELGEDSDSESSDNERYLSFKFEGCFRVASGIRNNLARPALVLADLDNVSEERDRSKFSHMVEESVILNKVEEMLEGFAASNDTLSGQLLRRRVRAVVVESEINRLSAHARFNKALVTQRESNRVEKELSQDVARLEEELEKTQEATKISNN